MNIYLAGCGKIGQRLGKRLTTDGHHVVGLKRGQANVGFPIIPTDLADAEAVKQLPPDADAVVFTVTPTAFSERGYANVYDDILGNMLSYAKRCPTLPLFILVSSTGVYGQQNGEWVDENSETQPDTYSGRWVLFGEQQLRKTLSNTVSVRFAGIYGDNRTRLIQQALSGQPIQQTPPQWTNRVHEDDCVGVLHFLLNQYDKKTTLEDIYLVCDDTPVSRYNVSAAICELANQPKPPIKTDNLSNRCNKRCDNQRIKQLGYRFVYPTFQQGYAAIISNLRPLQ